MGIEAFNFTAIWLFVQSFNQADNKDIVKVLNYSYGGEATGGLWASVGNKNVHHSDEVGVSPAGAAPTSSKFST